MVSMVDFFVVLHLGLDYLGLLLVDNDLLRNLGLHSLGELCTVSELLGLLQDRLILGFDCVGIFFLEIYADFVVDERKNHAIMDRDKIRWLVLGVLARALHKNKGTVCGHLVFSLLTDKPALLVGVVNVAVVCRHCLKLDLHLTLHRAADGELVLGKSLKDDFLLN